MPSHASDSVADLSILFEQVREGEDGARARLIAEVYGELRRLARQRLSGAPQDSIQPTELVHEMYGRIFKKDQLRWANRRHFFSVAGRAMQDILVERARAAMSQKRGGDSKRVIFDSAFEAASDHPEELIMLDTALRRLSEDDEMAAEVVRLRFFVGLTGDESAEALGVSPATVDRRWTYAKAWLHRALYADTSGPSQTSQHPDR